MCLETPGMDVDPAPDQIGDALGGGHASKSGSTKLAGGGRRIRTAGPAWGGNGPRPLRLVLDEAASPRDPANGILIVAAVGAFHDATWHHARAMLVMLTAGATAHAKMEMRTFPVLAGAGAHDVYPAPDGAVWFTAQSAGKLGRLDPRTGKSDLIALGPGAAPHGVIVGPDGAAWVTEGGQNAIARVDSATRAVKLFPLPKERRDANLNTAAFDHQGVLWFTGQNGVYGRLDPKSGTMAVFDAPRGTGPYGITTTPEGRVFFASLAGNYLGRIDLETGTTTVLEPPVPRQGARRVWSDSRGETMDYRLEQRRSLPLRQQER